jgi:hypothetical protein
VSLFLRVLKNCIQNFSQETSRRETTQDDNIKTNPSIPDFVRGERRGRLAEKFTLDLAGLRGETSGTVP